MIQRNDSCPCGSGRKFKKCCLLRSPGAVERTTGAFRFEPGSYGGPSGYMLSLACFSESALRGAPLNRIVMLKQANL